VSDERDVPLTRPNSTKPPAATILEYSPVLVGLWSYDMGFASPPTERTARESPAFACRHPRQHLHTGAVGSTSVHI
jgi:hypothetical protein